MTALAKKSARPSVRHLLIVAAGTGGHVMPGLAVAQVMRERGWTVSWLGTRSGMEKTLVPKYHLPFDAIDFTGLRGKGWRGAVSGSFKLLRALWTSACVLRRRKPSVVFGTGGYVCVPVGLMAKLFRKPLVLLNADAAWLMSTRFLKPLAHKVAFGFPVDANNKAVWTGNPVRAEVAALPAPAERFANRSGALRVLIIGGSLGAMVLNETVPRALGLLNAAERPEVTHQAGQRHVEQVRAAYATQNQATQNQATQNQATQSQTTSNQAPQNLSVQVLPFIDDMASAYADADVVICRAGAITVAELCAAGVAAILVPLRLSTTAHQTHNAQWLANLNGAIHLPQSELTAQKLADLLRGLTRPQLQQMAQRAHAQAKLGAANAVADLIEGAGQ